MYVNLNTLPACITNALKSVKYGKSDIEVIHTNSVSPGIGGGDGSKGFVIVVNLNTGETKTMWGSWGGANMFNTDNAVDLDTSEYPLEPGIVVIKGVISSHPTWARIFAHQDSSVLPLPSTTELSEKHMMCLYAHKALKGGSYRKEYMQAKRIGSDIVDDLVNSGYLKQNKAGATQITTEGKNIIGHKCYY